MNRLLKLIEREHGLSNDSTYDFALRRLCVAKEDSWLGIAPAIYIHDYNPEPPIFSAKFAKCDGNRHMLAIANEDGKIAIQDVTKRNTTDVECSLPAPQCHFNAVFDLEWAPGQMRIVSASGDHTARLWDCSETGLRELRVYVGHTRSVKTAAFRQHDSAVFATGGRDGAILIWDTRANLSTNFTPRADNCIYSGHGGGPGTPISQRKQRTRAAKTTCNPTSSSITGLAFQDSNTLISCGAGDGVIKVWDLRRNYTSYKKEPTPRHSLPYAGYSTYKGFTNLLVDEAGSRLYANCMDNTIYCYNLCSYAAKPLACYKGFLNSTFYIKSCLSPDGKYLLSGSSDEKAYIWNLNYPEEPLVALSGHSVEVTCVAWGKAYDQPIVTCSDDARHKIWRIGPEYIPEADKVELYRGHAQFMRQFNKKPKLKHNLLELESTPRSLKRLVAENERTPSSIEKITTKRTYNDLCSGLTANEANEIEHEQLSAKRTKILESRGRRLFSPATGSGAFSRNLNAIEEEIFNHKDNNRVLESPLSRNHLIDNYNQENALETFIPCNTNKTANIPTTSPLCENLNFKHCGGYHSPPTTAGSGVQQQHQQQNQTMATLIFSPTSNLPNYVVDGDAPHLSIMSPKRKIKEKVDWLTKIRKQKLMSSGRNTLVTFNEKLQACNESAKSSSPRVQHLRNTEYSPRMQASPRRRISHNDQHHHHSQQMRTPTSSRRNSSETTLLRFFTLQRGASLEKHTKPELAEMRPLSPIP